MSSTWSLVARQSDNAITRPSFSGAQRTEPPLYQPHPNLTHASTSDIQGSFHTT